MLVVLHTKLAFFIKFLVHAWSRHAWRFEQRVFFYVGSQRAKALILTPG